jgi:xylose isomerase
MRTYLILAEKARRFREDAEIQEALFKSGSHELDSPTTPSDGLQEILHSEYDEGALAARGYGHEHLDQLVTELLLGVR